ncbi:CopD family protein [Acinetobacter pittii]|uniref:CopD family protein n=1 Tax=Acinetobacter pittii TaxID=48296 RepID=UPI0035A2DAD9
MIELFTTLNPWLKAIHIVSMTIFISGVLAASFSFKIDLDITENIHIPVWAQREYRWDQIMTTPALFITFASGLIIAIHGQWFSSKWLPAKIAFVLILAGIHGFQAKLLRQIANGINVRKKQATLIILICTISIIVLAIIKP